MKIKTKENNGVTLVALVITIIIMLILATIVTYTGMDTYKQARVTKFVTQMQLIQKKVDYLVQANNTNDLGTVIDNNLENYSDIANAINSANNAEEIDSLESNFKYFSKENLQEQLEIEDIDDEVAINFNTREVVSIEGVEYDGYTYYTQYLLPGGQKIVPFSQTNTTLSFALDVYIDGLNANVIITDIKREQKVITNRILRYKLLPDNDTVYVDYNSYNIAEGFWQNIADDTVNLTKSGRYVFALSDTANTTPAVEEILIQLTNSPKITNGMTKAIYDTANGIIATSTIIEGKWYDYSKKSSKWAYSMIDGNYYIWIPRFVYNSTDNANVKFLKGNSDIPTDNSNINIETDWILSSKFTRYEQQLTGVWLKMNIIIDNDYEDIIELLNSSSEADIIPII